MMHRGILMNAVFPLLLVSLLIPQNPHAPLKPGQNAQIEINADKIFFPRILSDRNWITSITLTNPEARFIDVTIHAYDGRGLFLGELNGISRLGPMETRTIDSHTFPAGTASLVAEASEEFSGYATFESTNGNKLEIIPGIRELSTELNFPLLTSNDSFYKTIYLLNPTRDPAAIDLTAFDKYGNVLKQTSLANLSPMESRSIALSEVMNVQQMRLTTDVRMHSNRKLAGIQCVDFPDGDIVGLPSLSDSGRSFSLVVPNSTSQSQLWTSVFMFNPSDETDSVTLGAYDTNNQLLDQPIEIPSIPPRGIYWLPTSNVGGPLPANGSSFKVVSDHSVCVYAVVGVQGGKGLSAFQAVADLDLVRIFRTIYSSHGQGFAIAPMDQAMKSNHSTPPSPPNPFGADLGDFNGVKAYSNGSQDYNSCDHNEFKECDFPDPISSCCNHFMGKNTGMKWQCVEYVKRYYWQIYGIFLDIPGKADTWYKAALDGKLLLDHFDNGHTTTIPQMGDIIAMNQHGGGHVSIVEKASENSVSTAQQNFWGSTGTRLNVDLALSRDPITGFYTLTGKDLSIQGWLRRPGEKSLIKADDGSETVYWDQHGKLYAISSLEIIDAMTDRPGIVKGAPGWSVSSISILPASSINAMPHGPDFIFKNTKSDGLLIRKVGADPVYLIENGTPVWIKTQEALNWMGVDWSPDIIDVTETLVSNYLLPQGNNYIYGVGEGESDQNIKNQFINAYNTNATDPICAKPASWRGWPGSFSNCVRFPINQVQVGAISVHPGFQVSTKILAMNRLYWVQLIIAVEVLFRSMGGYI